MGGTYRVRDVEENGLPSPTYEFCDLSAIVRFQYGGKLTRYPRLSYIAGDIRVADHVDEHQFTIEGLVKICKEAGITGVSGFYLQTNNGQLKSVLSDSDLSFAFTHLLAYWNKVRVLHVYVDVSDEVLATSHENKEEGNLAVDEDEDEDAHLEYFSESEYDVNSDTDVALELETNLAAQENRGEGTEAEEENVRARADEVEEEQEGDEGVEDDGPTDDHEEVSEGDEEDIVLSGADFTSEPENEDEENPTKYPVFTAERMMTPIYDVGLQFPTKDLLRRSIHSHAVNTQRKLKITKNDKKRLHAKCTGVVGCPWKLHAIRIPGETTYQIRVLDKKHKCTPVMNISNLKSKQIGERFVDLFKSDPKRNMEGFKDDSSRILKCNVSMHQAYRGRKWALQLIHGSPAEQYSLLWDFIDEVKRTNPGSTMIMGIDNVNGRHVFDRFYMCLGALKEGFSSGCRPVIGIDGCFLKGPYKGQLLTAVGIDPNNNIYPLAWAAVEKENEDTWSWFMMTLKNDLMIENTREWTIMSDKQKGLINAVQEIFPGCEHRFCVRHLHGNMKKAGWTGIIFKLKLWGVAKANTEAEQEQAMAELIGWDLELAQWFADKPPNQWCKSHFRTYPKCDILLNNGCESFNAAIMPARERGILSMMEWMHVYVMKRHQKNRDKARYNWKEKLCPKITAILDKQSIDLGDCQPIKSAENIYMVECYSGGTFFVNLALKTCGCRKWDLSGIPCVHALRAIGSQGLAVEDYVDRCYHVDTYKDVYAPIVFPINGRALRTKSANISPLPPIIAPTVGRPQTLRRPEADEPIEKGKKRRRGQKKPAITPKGNLKRFQRTCKCRICGEEGHNAKTCKRKNLSVDREAENEDVRGTQQTVIDNDGFPTQQFTPEEGSSSQNQRQPPKKLKPIRKEKGKSAASAPFKQPSKASKKKSVPMSFQTMAAARANVSRQAAESVRTSKSMSFQQTSTEVPTPTPTNPNASLFQTTALVQQLLQQHPNEIGGNPSIGPVNFVGSAINMNVETRPKKGNGGKTGKKETK